jgi:hypothetical protein
VLHRDDTVDGHFGDAGPPLCLLQRVRDQVVDLIPRLKIISFDLEAAALDLVDRDRPLILVTIVLIFKALKRLFGHFEVVDDSRLEVGATRL